MSLKNIIGQEKAISILRGIMQRQRLATSFLFCGEPGIGKKTTAINFAKALNCLKNSQESGVRSKELINKDKNTSPLLLDPLPEASHLTPDTSLSQDASLLMPDSSLSQDASHLTPDTSLSFDSCDECDSCLKIDSGTHPDFILISPEDRIIKIEEIRMIDEALSFKPFEADKKLVIVDDAETMNISAANAFLKTLEEPPQDSIIILVSSRPDRLPETIRSRCSRINFKPLSTESCMQALKDKIPQESLELVTRLCMGRPGTALSCDLVEEKAWFVNLFMSMMNAEKDGWTSREDMEKWLELSLTIFRDLAVLKITGGTSGLINIDIREYLNKLSKSADLKVIINLYNELSSLKDLLFFNLNKSVTWNYTASLLRKELSV